MDMKLIPETMRVWLAASLLVLSSPLAQALPADMEADRLVLAAEEKIAQQDFEGARQYLERVGPLKAEPRPDFFYLFGQVKQHDGDLPGAEKQLSQYVSKTGREGEHYEEALRLLTQIEEQLRSQKDVAAGRDKAGDLKAAGIEASDTEGKAYDDQVRKLYPAASLQDSLVTHINSLLRSYIYLEGKIKNPDTSNRESYSLSVKAPSEILVTRNVRDSAVNNGQASLSVVKINAFGVSPFVSYRCSGVTDSCLLQNPASGEAWIRIANDEKAAKDLSTALTRLIKALQR